MEGIFLLILNFNLFVYLCEIVNDYLFFIFCYFEDKFEIRKNQKVQ